MPPKKKGKGKKKSKKELEKERLLEEERLRAEEEARLAEQQRKELELRESQQREALEALFRQEQERFKTEAEALASLMESQLAELTAVDEERHREMEWQTLLECRPLPNPQKEREVNTYLDLWSAEDLNIEEGSPLVPLFSELPAAEILCSQIEQELSGAGANDDAYKNRLTQHLLRLRTLIHDKWDSATSQILQHVDQFSREPNENFQLAATTQDYAFGVWGNLTKNPRYKTIEFAERKLTTSLPKPLVLSNVAIRMLLESSFSAPVPYEKQNGSRNLSVIGPVLLFDLLEMPDPAKTVDTWTIRPILSKQGKPKRISYPFKKDLTEVPEEEQEEAADASIWPMLVTYSLDPGCFANADAATVRWWNEEEKMWDDEGISDVEIEADAGLVKFRTIHFAPTATVQGTYAEFPLRDWDIHPSGPNSAIIHIRGTLSDIKIEIGEGNCRLMSPHSEYTESHLGDRWMSPPMLFKTLSRMGLKFIGPTSMKGVEIADLILKNPAVEDMCIIGIGAFASHLAFRRSPSNRHMSSSKCVFQFRPYEAEDEWPLPDEAEWQSVVFDVNWRVGEATQAAGFIASHGQAITDSTTFIVNSEDNKGTIHSTTYHLLQESIASPKGTDSSPESSPLFSKTVRQILGITRLMCFS
ncbi:uncharacterized protein SPPG_00646 [Spizellomyces punctatus DAOM BR117]|uniref:IC97/Casc1 N-terminal domain-containing protein n=1 Tax=Spizellomyces punctatus (strain DAOM BR117) TaxID=645134 RepID=A0A0L0HVQ1_SPIPD|nr:uncharacterized protein SPPG_00646 [Spizellomyces punctatus DAOM BR117]KND04959.1 hypothetical protein SPPG_00646 [Spizellomyces punctatus DAOM BR117]|eukprot:XP_016612998.1 hypothetical protein SPPG_00646 [Spizellomyces punctatus DAOM BR117]